MATPSLKKLGASFLAIIATFLACYLVYQNGENLPFIAIITGFSFLSWKQPKAAWLLIFFLPILGEYSRLNLLNKSLIASDLLIPVFILIQTFLGKLNISKNLRKTFQTLTVFLGIATLSLLVSTIAIPLPNLLNNSLYLIRLISYALLFPITYNLFKKTPSELIKYFLLSALLISFTGFAQLVFLPDLKELAETQGYDPHINRLVGSWLDPNFLGGLMAMAICLSLSLLTYVKKQQQKLILASFLLIYFITLFLTYSRSAYLATAVGLLIIGLLKARKLIIAIFIFSIILISISDRAQQRVGELITSINSVIFNTAENADPTARLRLQNWEQTLTLIQQKPLLGHGYNNLSTVKTQEGFVANQEIHSASGSDSSLLTILATTGFIGLAAYLTFFINLLYHSWPGSKNTLQTSIKLGVFSALISLLIHSNFVNSLLFPPILIYIFCLAALPFFKKPTTTV